MNNLKEYILEKFRLSKNIKLYKYHPKDSNELRKILLKLMPERGENANLNDIDVSNITDFCWTYKGQKESVFYKLDPHNIDVSEWQLYSATSLSHLFDNCENFCADLSNWDVSNVTNMESMFLWCKNFTGKGLENWDVSNVINMKDMFRYCRKFNIDVSKWKINKNANLISLFNDCWEFEGKGLENWDISNITKIAAPYQFGMFTGCKNFTGKSIENWNVSNITNMTHLFWGCENLNCDLSKWDVSNVTNMETMFRDCKKFEGKGLETWDVSNVTDMQEMFEKCEQFTGKSIENWNVSKVIDISVMFIDCSNLNCNLSKWNIRNVKYRSNVFKNSPLENNPPKWYE